MKKILSTLKMQFMAGDVVEQAGSASLTLSGLQGCFSWSFSSCRLLS